MAEDFLESSCLRIGGSGDGESRSKSEGKQERGTNTRTNTHPAAEKEQAARSPRET